MLSHNTKQQKSEFMYLQPTHTYSSNNDMKHKDEQGSAFLNFTHSSELSVSLSVRLVWIVIRMILMPLMILFHFN